MQHMKNKNNVISTTTIYNDFFMVSKMFRETKLFLIANVASSSETKLKTRVDKVLRFVRVLGLFPPFPHRFETLCLYVYLDFKI